MEKILSKKVIIVFLASLTTLIFTSVFYILFNTKSIILETDLTCNFREKIYLKDFIFKLDGTLQNDHQIDTTTVGKKKIKAIYKDNHGFYKAKSFTIEIKDITPPTILVNNDYTIEKSSTSKLEKEIICADDTDDDITCNINGSYNLDEVGTYPLTITATDDSNNTTTKNFNLNVVEPPPYDPTPKEESSVSYQEIYQKYKTNNTLIGVDISKWQQDVDFQKLKENNVEFVILKLGGQTSIDSNISLDPNFISNLKNAKKAGLKVGLYFYSYAKTIKEARQQANYIIKNIKNYDIDLPIAFDWENWDNYNNFKLSFNSLNKVAQEFINTLNKKGYQTLLYSSEYYLDKVWFSEDYDNIWLANYGTISYQGNYDYWQLCSDGRVEGINTYVDIDIMYLNN